jgi:hypothetical protein
MLESCLGAFIWYVFEGAQCQITKFLFSDITQMGHFLEQVSIQKLGAQPRTQFFQGRSHQQLEKCLVYSISYGGGGYHNSVKTSIFKNSVIYYSLGQIALPHHNCEGYDSQTCTLVHCESP